MKDLKDLVDYDRELTNENCIAGAVILFTRELITPMKFIELVREMAVPEEQIQEFFAGGWIMDKEDWDKTNKTLYG
jgi:hypothetical protein